ncbi:uncharacterized protein [Scyliorhinus torazame]|uniref:uncharacterized protein n=1 Tax=Scyliorhinus torazame TaxID=75743 RepID=UPI003B5B5639
MEMLNDSRSTLHAAMDSKDRFAYSNPALTMDETIAELTVDICSTSKSTLQQTRDVEAAELRRRTGMELKFRGLDMEIKGRGILCNVSGTVQPGELLAVMGPSGSGKTTLLSSLSGRQRVQSGTIKISGVPLNKRLRRTICYVMQQDIFFPNLTLKDTLMYQAHLKLPSTLKLHEKEQIVTNIVEELDIKKCYNTSE